MNDLSLKDLRVTSPMTLSLGTVFQIDQILGGIYAFHNSKFSFYHYTVNVHWFDPKMVVVG